MADRLFVAIWPDAPARAALAEAVEVARGAHPDIRWQPEERWHITLAFLGDSEPEPARSTLDALFLPSPEPISLAGSGSFGAVVWVGVRHGPWLAELAALVQRRLRVDDLRFRAHLTVGRARGGRMTPRARSAAEALESHSGPAWTPEALTLVGSRMGPRPEYQVIATWPLG